MRQVKENIVNLVLAFFLGISVMFIIGASSGVNGRYNCCAAGGDSQSVYVVDSQTGQTWRMSRNGVLSLGTPENPKSERSSVTPKVK